jgi:hypothetical protein
LEISLLSVRTGLTLRFGGKNKILIASLGALISFCCVRQLADQGSVRYSPQKRNSKATWVLNHIKQHAEYAASFTLELNK